MLSSILPIGILAKLNNKGTVEQMKIGWLEDNADLLPIRLVTFSIEKGPNLNGIYTDFSLELFPWDGAPLVRNKSGLTHEIRNKRGNLVARQTVATDKKLNSLLEGFLKHTSVLMIESCKIPKTIKKA